LSFFLVFYIAYKKSITVQNAKIGFRGVGLVLYNPQVVISKLNVKLQTPTFSATSSAAVSLWVFQTFHNATNAFNQSTLVKNRII